MPSKRLYYDDAYTTRFAAAVSRLTSHDGRPAVALAQSYFYPTSGGQPHDIGSLGGSRVLDVVVDGGSDDVLHVLDRLPEKAVPGAILHGEIDWKRRFDYMQQHTGQHLLSQLFFRLFAHETVAVHFGAEVSTVELTAASISEAELAALEEAANQLVFDNLHVRTYFADQSRLATLPLRRPPAHHAAIRIVEIEEFDFSACGGAHVGRTGEIGPIKLLRQERVRGQIRVAFLCGWRALRDYAEKRAVANDVAALFSTEPTQTPALTAALQAENRALQRTVGELNERLLNYTAAELLANAQRVGELRLVAAALTDLPPTTLKTLAQLLQAAPQTVALLAGTSDEKVTAVFACSDDLPLHMGEILRTTLGEFGGSGGGRATLAQGGGVLPAHLPDLIEFARIRTIEELTRP